VAGSSCAPFRQTRSVTKNLIHQTKAVFSPNGEHGLRRFYTMKCNLILHCGANAVERSAVSKVKTPSRTATWTPIPHLRFVEQVERSLHQSRLNILSQAHALSHEGNRYFGLIQVQGGRSNSDYGLVLGLRNSHDKTFPAGLVAGAQVFVCDNLSFNGEVKLSRKHTRFINRDLPMLTQRAIGQLQEKWHHQEQRIDRYMGYAIDDRDAHDLMVRAVDVGVCPVTILPKVVQEWRQPSHDVFRDRTVWSLFNGFTEALKGNLHMLPGRTQALHALMDGFVGIAGKN